MSQYARPTSQSQPPRGVPFPMPGAQGQGPAPFPFPMPAPPSPQAAQMSSDQMQEFASQFAEQFAEQFAKKFAEQLVQQIIQQTVSYMPFVPQVPSSAAKQAAQAQPAVPPIFAPFAPAPDNAEKKDAKSQPPLPFMPFVPFAPQAPGADSQQSASMPFPGFPIPQFQNGMPQPQGVQGFPYAMPFPAPFVPNAQPSDDVQPSDDAQTIQTPFGPMPQPYEMYEQLLKGSIDVLGRLLATSKAVRGASSNEKAEKENKSDETDKQASQAAPFVPPMPGFGLPQIPMPQPPMQKGSSVGMMPRSDQLGNLLGTLFGASNTEYFYED